jgi:glutamate/tyrosine decarboxylase-like PLP-dependent enzyme
MQRAFHELIRAAETVAEQIAKGPLATQVGAAEVRKALARFDFREPVALLDLTREVTQMLQQWSVHVTHPRYFGLFNPSVATAGVLADAITAIYNPQLASWSHAPAAQEIERHTLSWLAKKFGVEGFANFASGGAEANQTALLCALARRYKGWARRGARGAKVFVTSESHHSIAKAASMCGIGSDAVQRVRTDGNGRMDPEDLDRKAKRERPAMIVGTAGTTASGVIDPLPAIADICRKYNIWFHADAAWGGAAVVSPTLRPHLAGIERADSVTCDAHKWFSVPMGAGMFFTRDRGAVGRAFRIETPYMPARPADADNPYETTMQWSRRFIGLKLFLTLAEAGEEGLAVRLDHQAQMGDYLRNKLRREGWKVVNETPLPLVCFTRDGLDVAKFVAEVQRRQIAWISSVSIAGGPPVARACITSYRTEHADIDAVVRGLCGVAAP